MHEHAPCLAAAFQGRPPNENQQTEPRTSSRLFWIFRAPKLTSLADHIPDPQAQISLVKPPREASESEQIVRLETEVLKSYGMDPEKEAADDFWAKIGELIAMVLLEFIKLRDMVVTALAL